MKQFPAPSSSLAAAPRWPDTFVVGAPRCGTTAMYVYLQGHGQVCMAALKEPHFFAPDLAPGLPGTVIRDSQRYLALFANTAHHVRMGEASPFYLYSQEAPEAIRRHCPDARIIIMLRNPADMMYSLYLAWAYAGIERLHPFETALAAEHRRRSAHPPPIALLYSDLARYADRVERYLTAFGRSRVHVVLFDDLVGEPGAMFRDVCRFLEIPSGQPPQALGPLQRAASMRPRIRWLSRFVSRPPASFASLLGTPPGRWIRDAVRRWGSTPPPPLSPAVRRRLLASCEADIKRLADVLGRDLRRWKAD